MPRVIPGIAEVSIYSYGRLGQHSPSSSYVIDVMGLRDPYSNRGFKNKYPDGRAGEIQDYVKEDDRVPAIVESVKMLAYMHLRSDGADKKWLSFAFRDHFGKWISPCVAEITAEALSRAGYNVSVYHYDLPYEETK